MAAEPQSLVAAELDRLAGHLSALGIAVSGGGDSTALMHMAAEWGRARGIAVEVATVDHGLRPEAAAEAEGVAHAARALGLPHRVLRWDHGDDVPGNLMDAARRARMALLARWAAGRGLGAIALGHTQDDQAETLLMRLERGAGVDGLSAMQAARDQGGALWLRPMLGVRRAALREWLTARGIGWVDDPGNDDPAYGRVRARQAIAALRLDVAGLARSAARLAEARAALSGAAVVAAEAACADRGMLRLPVAAMAGPAEIRRRLVAGAIRWVTGDGYAPRGPDLARMIAALDAGGQATLAGVIARAGARGAEFLREPAAARRAGAVVRSPGAAAASWDRRWALTGLRESDVVRAVGEADLAGHDWRAAGLPRAALLSSPAVERDGRVLLPLLDADAPVSARPLRDRAAFHALLLAH